MILRGRRRGATPHLCLLPGDPISMMMKHEFGMLVLGLSLAGAVPRQAQAEPGTNAAPADKVPYARDLGPVKRTVETLRGKRFEHDVPAFTVSERQMRAVVDEDLEKNYPGRELADYEALLRWLDVLPPDVGLRSVAGAFFVGGVAGFYNTDTREMCIPAVAPGRTNAWRHPANTEVKKELGKYSSFADDIVFAHEFTHALEDQYWPLEDPELRHRRESTDRGAARSFVAEGSATRIMIEAVPAIVEEPSAKSAGEYIAIWTLIHSRVGEAVLNYELKGLWKSPEAQVPGVPDTLARSETMPYGFGYVFCSKMMRDWGIDGLDYFAAHPPASTEQVIHPEKAWAWRDLPVQIAVPQTWSNGWTQRTGECLGEAGIAALLGCSLTNLNRGEKLARGWDGDRAALFEGPDGGHLLLWASAWDSAAAAQQFARAWAEQRRTVHQAAVVETNGHEFRWTRADGRAGIVRQTGCQVICLETDRPAELSANPRWFEAVAFTQPPEDAARARANSTLARVNPFYARRRDADYTVSQTLWGVLWRHDRNSIGAADSFALGALGEWRRTESFRKWELGWSWVAKHKSDARQGTSQTAVLPWGMLYSRFSAKVPQRPEETFSRARLLWGLAASQRKDSLGNVSSRLLPFGLLFRSDTQTNRTSVHILGTGVAHTRPTATVGGVTRFRLLGIPLWTKRSAPPS
jgi:hypothetical protein